MGDTNTGEKVRSQLPIKTCRRLIGDLPLSDAALELLREQFYGLAESIVAMAVQPATAPGEGAPSDLIPEDERYEVEERAAIFQFEARMPPEQASRAALAAHFQSHRKAGTKPS